MVSRRVYGPGEISWVIFSVGLILRLGELRMFRGITCFVNDVLRNEICNNLQVFSNESRLKVGSGKV